MQYIVWAEMKCGELHDSVTNPPATSMFVRAGGTTTKKGASVPDPMSQAICQLASALTPNLSAASRGGGSPARVIKNRSKFYRQLAELMMQSGLLSEEEYASERQAIVDTLNKLKEK